MGILMGFMLRSLPGTVPNSNFSLGLFLNINQFDALNFIISLFQASTCFEHVLIFRRAKFSASSWLILRNKYIEMHGLQNIKKKKSNVCSDNLSKKLL